MKILIVFVIILLLAFGGYLVYKSSTNATGVVIIDNSKQENAKIFAIESSNLKFYIDGIENPDIRVKEGDRVRIELKGSDGFHDWKIDEFNAATDRINPGEATYVEFIVDKKGTFEYYCSVGEHRANGMKGRFIVE